MNLPLFIARRIYRGGNGKSRISGPAVIIAMTGIAVGLAVMIIAVSVIVGFKGEIRDKVVGFGSHIQITNLNAAGSYESHPIAIDDSLLDLLYTYNEIAHVQRYSTKAGMLKTQDSFQGILLKGIAQEYDTDFFRNNLVEGELPQFSDSVAANNVIISRTIAEKMRLKVGDKIDTYYIQDNVRARRLTVTGIYQTNFSEYDNVYLLTDLSLVNRLNDWDRGQVGGLEIRLHDYGKLDEVTWNIATELEGKRDGYGSKYGVVNVRQMNPQIFAWLDILDVNIWVILILMMGVAGFTMVSGLLIIIIERTSMIGILKSLGACNLTIRKIFLWFSVFLIGRGMVWGNVIGLGFYLLQRYTGVFSLNPDNYYMDTVPVSFTLPLFLLLNVCTLLVSVLMLVGPSCLISRIRPADSMRYE